jgi:DNA-binding CsgD family transcriptional regulator
MRVAVFHMDTKRLECWTHFFFGLSEFELVIVESKLASFCNSKDLSTCQMAIVGFRNTNEALEIERSCRKVRSLYPALRIVLDGRINTYHELDLLIGHPVRAIVNFGIDQDKEVLRTLRTVVHHSFDFNLAERQLKGSAAILERNLKEFAEFSADEWTVLGLLSQGFTQNEIAEKLQVKRITIYRKLKRLFDKSLTENLSGLLIKAAKKNWIIPHFSDTEEK